MFELLPTFEPTLPYGWNDRLMPIRDAIPDAGSRPAAENATPAMTSAADRRACKLP
jgi:hypothetical protein